MMRTILVIILLLLPVLSFADKTEEELKAFLQSRTVIDRVYFSTASYQLSARSREELDRLVPELEKINRKDFLLRVEGFASPEGSVSRNVNLSMYRAMAVHDYFRDEHGLDIDLFLTGFGGSETSLDSESSRRVDIALYRQAEATMALFDEHGTEEKIIVK